MLENVVHMRSGRCYGELLHRLQNLGYHLREHILDASRFGVPQSRRRLILVGDRSQRPLHHIVPHDDAAPDGRLHSRSYGHLEDFAATAPQERLSAAHSHDGGPIRPRRPQRSGAANANAPVLQHQWECAIRRPSPQAMDDGPVDSGLEPPAKSLEVTPRDAA